MAASADYSDPLQEPLNMTSTEKRALKRMVTEISKNVDPVALVVEFHKKGCITGELKTRIYKLYDKSMPRTQLCSTLLDALQHQMTMQRFIQCLFKCRYQSLACKLFVAIMEISKEKIGEICGNRSTCRAVHPYVFTLANNEFNFTSQYQALRRLAASPLAVIHKTSDIRQRELISSALVEIQGTEVLPKVKSNSDIAVTCDMQTKIQTLSTAKSGDEAEDVSYYTSMAELANALGNHAFAEQMRVSADLRQYADANVIENLNLLYTEVSVKLLELERIENDDSDLKDELLMWAYIGINLIEVSGAERLTAWKRLFILQIVSCLLSIGSNGTIYSNNANKEDLQEAKDLLAQLDSLMNGTSSKRQQILYFVAKSRQSECSGDFELAKIYISKAKQVESQGASVQEIGKHVRKYELEILGKLHRKSYDGYRCITSSDENAMVARQINSSECASPSKEIMNIPFCANRKCADELICAVMPQQLFTTSQTLLRDGQIRTEQTRRGLFGERRVPPPETCMSPNLAHLQSLSKTQRDILRTESNNRSVAINVTYSQQDGVEYSFRAAETQQCIKTLKPPETESLRNESEQISLWKSLETNVHDGADLNNLSDFLGAAPVLDNLKCDQDTVSGGSFSLDTPSYTDSVRKEDSPKLTSLKLLAINREQTEQLGQKLNPFCRLNTQCKSYGLEEDTLGKSCRKHKQSDKNSKPKTVKIENELHENFQRMSVKQPDCLLKTEDISSTCKDFFATQGTNTCLDVCLAENESSVKGLSNRHNQTNPTFSAVKINMRFECTDDEMYGSGTENIGSNMMNVKEKPADNFFPDVLLSSRGTPDGASCE